MTRIVLITLLALTLAGCGDSEPDAAVVAAFYPLAYAAERVGDAEVRNLTPPGVEPHDFELSGRDVETIAGAELVLYLGQGFQPALEAAVASTDANALDLLEGLDLLQGDDDRGEEEPHEGEDEEHAGEGGFDPHVWLDPLVYAELVERIGGTLGREAAARELVAELEQLDDEFRQQLADCERRELVTSHAAFGYLTERYDLEQVAITGLSPEAEPTPGELRDVVDEVREHGATTIFFETLVSPRLAETVAREVGATTAVLNPLEGLTEQQAEDGEDYFSVMRANLASLRTALGCS